MSNPGKGDQVVLTSYLSISKLFAMPVKGRFVARLPRERVDALVAAGDAEQFDPGHGRRMKEWASLEPDSQVEWLALANEAMAYASSKR